MNGRSDPATYMVQQVAQAVENNNVKSRFKIALAWGSKTDLDGWLVCESLAKTGRGVQTTQKIGYSNPKTSCGHTKLDFDANASPGAASMNPVENFTMSDKTPSEYTFYVNNYSTREGNSKTGGASATIPFTVVVNLDGEVTTYEDTWDTRQRSDNP